MFLIKQKGKEKYYQGMLKTRAMWGDWGLALRTHQPGPWLDMLRKTGAKVEAVVE